MASAGAGRRRAAVGALAASRPAGSAPPEAAAGGGGGSMAGAPAPGSRRPPSKRARGPPSAAAPDPEDPFSLHGDFTADDLEELDILASQALSQWPPAARGASRECARGSPRGRRGGCGARGGAALVSTHPAPSLL